MTSVRLLCSFRHRDGFDAESVFSEALRSALVQNYDDAEGVGAVTVTRVLHISEVEIERDGVPGFRWALAEIAVSLPEEADSAAQVIEDFCGSLTNVDEDVHILKFEDDLLLAELEARRREIYAVEMKLRRVLSLVYLRDRHRRDPFALLAEDRVSAAKDRPSAEDMASARENEFFYLGFSQYAELNCRREQKLPDLLSAISLANDFDELRGEIGRAPIERDSDANLIAGLLTRMGAVEAMRNCVAHNRQPSRRIAENYNNALPLLNGLLDDYLAGCGGESSGTAD